VGHFADRLLREGEDLRTLNGFKGKPERDVSQKKQRKDRPALKELVQTSERGEGTKARGRKRRQI